MKKIAIASTVILLLFSLWGEATYTVATGDTLFVISLRHNVPLGLLMELNDLSESSTLKIGQTLKIPDFYEVKAGDNYYRIAQRYKITVAELMDLNGKAGDDLLLVGEKLLVPLGDTAAVSGPGGAEVPLKNKDQPKTANASYGSSFWPHSGKRAPLTGKLQGEAFEGKPGDKILSVSSGEVVWVAPYRGYNKLIIVEAPNGYVFAYGGNDRTFVSVGDRVFPGKEIGNLGVNPHQGVAKAFFFVYKNGEPVDPSLAPRT